ncbi:glycosyltransferase, partial [Roseateles sp. P5_E8]
MKILLSVFACAPNTGSETGVGWRWAVELARAGHHVVAVTDETRRNQIENELELRPVPGLRFEFYRPVWLKRIPLNSKTAQLLFSAWQYSLLPFARGLHRLHRFDAVIHLTYGVFRTPSFLGGLKIPFVFGPVGGGEDAPWALKQGLPWRELIKEVVRTALIKISPLNPALRACLNSASVILVKTKDTKDALPRKSSARAIVYHEIGIQRQTESLEWTPIARGVN